MNIKKLKDQIMNLPDVLDDFEVVFSEITELEGGRYSRKDIVLETIAIDGIAGVMLFAKKSSIDVIDNLMSNEED